MTVADVELNKHTETAWALAKAEILNDPTLSDHERKILTTCTINNVIDEIKTLDHEHALQSNSRKVMNHLEPVLSGLQKYGQAMDVLSQADPQGILTLTWGSIRLLLAVAKGFYKYFDDLIEFLGNIARPLTRLEQYGILVPTSDRLQASLRNVFVDFLKFMHRTRRMFVDKTNKSNTLFRRPGATIFRKNLWQDFGDEVAREIDHINKLCKDAEHEADLASRQSSIGNQLRHEGKADVAFSKADSAYDRQDKAHEKIIHAQKQQLDTMQVDSQLSTVERGRQEQERQDQTRERSRQEEERIRQEDERNAQREERAKAAEDREKALRKVDEDKKAAEATLMKEVVDWLSPVDALDQVRQIREQRMKGTCDWILKHPTCEPWLKQTLSGDRPNLLWLHSFPGAGKTFLCTRIVEYLQERNKSVAVFYCDTKDDRKRRSINMLRTWTWQLLLNDTGKLRSVAELYRSGKQANITLFVDAIKTFLGSGEERYLVLDALDECESPTRIEILKILGEFKSAKILLTSRNENDISRALTRSGSSVASIKIEAADNAADIRHYLEEKIKDMQLEDKDLDYRIEEELFDAAHGMFLYARLMIGELSEKDSLAEIEEALDDLPSDLETIYGRVLSRIDGFPREAKKENARLLLKWICAANEPLTLDQIRDITAFNLDSDEDMLNPKKRLRSAEEFVYECCGPLVDIDTYDSKIRISHASVKDYLLSRGKTGDATYFVDHDEAHHVLARSCLAYLSYTNIDVVDVNSNHDESLARLETHLKSLPMLQYATLHWWRHTLFCSNPMDESLQRAFRKFAISNYHGVKWLQMIQYLRGDRTGLWHPGYNEYIKLLPYIVNINEAWRAVSDQSTWLDQVDAEKKYMRFHCLFTCYDMHYYAPITIAAMFNYPDVIERELARGVNINLTNWRGESPIMLAARGNAVAATETLLKHGADPSHIGDQTENALHRAISWYGISQTSITRNIGYDTVPLLLEAGADIHMRNFDGDTITHYVLRADYEIPATLELLQWILDAGGQDDLAIKNNAGATPLGIAAWRGLKGCVQILLDAGADPNGGMPRNAAHYPVPLIEAAKKDDPTMGLMLIDANAKVNISDPWEHHTPLIEACIRGSRLVEALLTAGADPNVPDKHGIYPLHHAAIENSVKSIPLLLKHGADLQVKDPSGKTALDLAVEQGRAESVKILTEAGAIKTIADAPQDTSVEAVPVYPQTERDTFHCYHLLKLRTRGQIHHARLVQIMNTAEYWIKTTVSREDFAIVTEDDQDDREGFLPYVISLPITGATRYPVQKIVISTLSHDQGWSSFPQHRKSYNDSWTGFRLRVRRTSSSANNWKAHLEHQGKDPKEIQEILSNEEHHIQSNRHGWPEEKLHVNVWNRHGDHDELIKSIRKGDILEVVPWAMYAGWQNHILSVKLEIYTAYLTLE